MAGRARKRRWWWLGGGLAVVVLLAVGGPFVYIHVIEGTAPARLTLPTVGSTTSTTGAGGATTATPGSTGGSASATASTLSGTWHVGAGSTAGYRVQEVLLGQSATAVGRTTTMSGTVAVDGTKVTSATVVVDMSSVKSDQSERNAQFDGRIMDVAAYPTAKLVLTPPVALGSDPATGRIEQFTVHGDLTMHGVTEPVTFPISLERTTSGVDVLADVPIVFSRWNISNPSVGGFVTTASDGTLEVLLDLTRGPGNPAVTDASSGGSGTSSGGAPSPVTVPSTTVPPLKLSSGG